MSGLNTIEAHKAISGFYARILEWEVVMMREVRGQVAEYVTKEEASQLHRCLLKLHLPSTGVLEVGEL